MVRAARLLAIRDLLRERAMSTAELAERFHMSQRVIQRDLLLLQGEPWYLPLEIVYDVRWKLSYFVA